MSPRSQWKMARAIGLTLPSLFAASASAAVVTWNNTAANFNDLNSWTEGSVPGDGDIATFASAAVTQPALSSDTTVSGLNFATADATAYTLSASSGQILSLTSTSLTSGTAALSASHVGTNEISAGIALAAAAGSTQMFTTAGSTTTLAITGVLSGGDSTSTLRLAGTGVYELRTANSFSGTIDQTAGNVLAVGHKDALGSSANVLRISSSSASFRALTDLSGANAIANDIELFANWRVQNSDVAIEFSGNIDLNGANRSIQAGFSNLAFAPVFSGVISDSSVSGSELRFTRNTTGGDLITLSNVNNSYTGPTVFQNVGGRVMKLGNIGENSSVGTYGTVTAGNLGSSHSASIIYIGAGESTNKTLSFQTASIGLASEGTGALTVTGGILFGGPSRIWNLRGDQAPTIVNRISTVVGDSTTSAAAMSISKSGTGTWQLDADNSFTGNVSVTGGTLVLAQAAAVGDNPSAKFVTVSATLATLFALDNTFLSKIVASSGGTLALGVDSAVDLPAAGITGNLSVGAWQNATLTAYTPATTAYRFGGGIADLTVSADLTTPANTMLLTPGGRVILTGNNTFNGNITPSSGAILRGADPTAVRSGDGVTVASVLGGTGVINVSSASATFTLELRANGEADASSQTLHFNKTMQASGAGLNFTVDVGRYSGAGTNKTLTLNYVNLGVLSSPDHSQMTVINVTGADGYSFASRNATAWTMGGGSVTGAMLINPTTANVLIGGNITNNATAASVKTLYLGGTSGDNRIAGAILNGTGGGLSAVVKNNSSTWTLNGASTYSGGTTVTAGDLIVNGVGTGITSSGLGTDTVAVTGGRLGGTGRILGNTSVSGGATLLAGNGVSAGEDLELAGDLNLLDGSKIQVVLGTGGTHSTLTRSGSGTWTFDTDQGFVMTADGLVGVNDTFDNVITGLAADPGTGLWTTVDSDLVGTFTYDGAGGVDFTVTAVPEPASLGLLVLSAGALLRRRRRVG